MPADTMAMAKCLPGRLRVRLRLNAVYLTLTTPLGVCLELAPATPLLPPNSKGDIEEGFLTGDGEVGMPF